MGAGGGNKGRPPASSRGTEDWASDSAPAYTGTVRDGGGTLTERQPRQLTVQTVSTVSDRTRRGKHTTRHVTLLRLPGGGLLADTPGFGLPTLEHVSSRQLAGMHCSKPCFVPGPVGSRFAATDRCADSCSDCFPEVRYALHQSGVNCSFANCAHLAEPGCVVRTDPPWERYWYSSTRSTQLACWLLFLAHPKSLIFRRAGFTVNYMRR